MLSLAADECECVKYVMYEYFSRISLFLFLYVYYYVSDVVLIQSYVKEKKDREKYIQNVSQE